MTGDSDRSHPPGERPSMSDKPSRWSGLREILRYEPDHVLAHTNLGSAFLDLRRPAEAVAALERAAAIKPDLPQPRVGLIKTYMALGRTDAAWSQLESLRGIDRGAAQHISPVFLMEW